MASDPPMVFKMAATASAWARVFSPESSDSLAIRGSAKARARTRAFTCSGSVWAVAAISWGTASAVFSGGPGGGASVFMRWRCPLLPARSPPRQPPGRPRPGWAHGPRLQTPPAAHGGRARPWPARSHARADPNPRRAAAACAP